MALIHFPPRVGLRRGPHPGWPWSVAHHLACWPCVHRGSKTWASNVLSHSPGRTAGVSFPVLSESFAEKLQVLLSFLSGSSQKDHEGSRIQVHHQTHPWPGLCIYSDKFNPQTHFTDEDIDGLSGPQSPTENTQLGEGFQSSHKVLENTVLTSWLVAKLLSG